MSNKPARLRLRAREPRQAPGRGGWHLWRLITYDRAPKSLSLTIIATRD